MTIPHIESDGIGQKKHAISVVYSLNVITFRNLTSNRNYTETFFFVWSTWHFIPATAPGPSQMWIVGLHWGPPGKATKDTRKPMVYHHSPYINDRI